MGTQSRKLSFTRRYVLAFGLLMLAGNIVLGLVILYQSDMAMKSLINSDMLDIVKTASRLLDGDVLGALTEEDEGSEAVQDIADELTAFMDNEDIEFIYVVRQAGEGRYIFTVDPDPVEPALFGEEIVLTDALVQAGSGIPSVDDQAVADRWGSYYSAYCPVFDSIGEVGGIVGIDFNADRYQAKIRQHIYSIALVTLLSVLLGGVVVFLINHSVRKSFGELDLELQSLQNSVNQLLESAGASSTESGEHTEERILSKEDEIRSLVGRVHSLQTGMQVYGQLQKEQFYKDEITGIASLNYMKAFSDEFARRLRAAGETATILYFDIRSMVQYNNQYGHSKGDELLRQTARILSEAFPEALVGRGEGDHFIVIDRKRPDIDKVLHEVNEKVKKAAYGKTPGIQCAIVSLEPETYVLEGIGRARNTLKKIGNDLNVIWRQYSIEEDNEFWMKQYIVQHVEEALSKGWIKVFYQIIYDTKSQKPASMEALARWVDPERGIISPGQFIPVLSQYHLLHKLDLYMVEQILREFEQRAGTDLQEISVSINFSAQDFDYINVTEELNRLMERYDLSRDRLIVEITEQDLAQGTAHFTSQLSRIRESGYQIWIDDFGAGYSSLNVFSQYDVDRIKFDMDLVRHLDEKRGVNRIIMKSIVDMCGQMDVPTLAEGVETEEQFRFLQEIDCGMVQGFYFAKPEPIENILRQHKREGAAHSS